MPDLISVIVPVYNASEYVSQCIDSILIQSYQELEILLIDDGSTDNSLQICEAYCRRDPRVQLIQHVKNRGLVSARKTGLQASRGKYIGFVDADDYIEPEMFKRLIYAIEKYDVDFVHSGFIVEGENICHYEENLVDFQVESRGKYIAENILRNQTMTFSLWSKLFRADLIKDAYLSLNDEQSYGEDLLCLCNCMILCNRFYMMRDAFYHYRVYDGSMSHLNWLNICFQESRLYEYITRTFRKNDLLKTCGDDAAYHYKSRILEAMMQDKASGAIILNYCFPGIEKLKNKRIAIYGSGRVGKNFYYQISSYGQCEITAWVDRDNHGIFNLIRIDKPEKLKEIPYELIILAVNKEEVADEIRNTLLQQDICKDTQKIVWEKPLHINNPLHA